MYLFVISHPEAADNGKQNRQECNRLICCAVRPIASSLFVLIRTASSWATLMIRRVARAYHVYLTPSSQILPFVTTSYTISFSAIHEQEKQEPTSIKVDGK